MKLRGEKDTNRKESIMSELEHQMSLGENGQVDMDEYLLDLVLDEITIFHGYEEASGIFEAIVLSSCLFGGGFMGACFTYLEGTQ